MTAPSHSTLRQHPLHPVSLPFETFQVGPYTITVLPVGQFALDGGAMFGVVPKVIWEKLTPTDHCNRIPLALNCLLVEYGQEKCLLDTGIGTKFPPKYQEMYGMVGQANIVWALEQLAIKPEAITKLLFTHLHFDHVGGATTYNENGELVLTFPNAKAYIHQGEWQWAMNPGPRTEASYLQENYRLLDDGQHLQLLTEPITEILSGLYLRTTGGHTAYHQIVTLEQPEGGFIYWGDILPTHHHLKIPYVMGYDLYPVDTMAQKDYWLQQAFEKQWTHIFEHDLCVPWCRLGYNPERRLYQPLPNLP